MGLSKKMWPTDKRENNPIEQDSEMVRMLDLSDRAFKITEKHVKGSSGKVVWHAYKDGQYQRRYKNYILKANKNYRNKKYGIRDEGWFWWAYQQTEHSRRISKPDNKQVNRNTTAT